MAKFMCTHTMTPGGLTIEQVRGFAKAGQTDPAVRGYRSFVNLTEGKAICVIEGPDAKTVGDWFKKMGMPFDSITRVEFEGDRGEVRTETPAATLRLPKPGLAA